MSAASIAPLVAMGLAAVAAMLLAPSAHAAAARAVAALGLAVATGFVVLRFGAPERLATELLADDPLARFGIALTGLSALAALAITRIGASAREVPALIAIAALGGALVCGARHSGALFLGLEVMGLSLVALFAFPLTQRALEAAYKYFILGAAGAAALLFGVAILYAAAGGLAFTDWRSSADGLFALGAALLLAGLAFKFALAPFHMWGPDVFEGASPSAVVIAGVTAKVAVAVALVRLAQETGGASLQAGLAGLGAASILVGNLFALRQTSLARMLGYSSIAHSGYVAAILGAGGTEAGAAALFYVASYAPALTAALIILTLEGGDVRLENVRGLFRRRPLEGAAFALGVISLAGLPPAVGFIGKLYLFSALIEAEAWRLLAVAAVGSGLGVYYYARFFGAPFLPCKEAPSTPQAAPRRHAGLAITCLFLVAVLGVYPMPLLEAAVFATR
ncbi:MAG: proton-conducting transporter membrane subunit [Pseudomonadota bacterium]